MSAPISLAAVREAKRMGLRYGVDDVPGITRVKKGIRFEYLAPNGKPVRQASVLKRIAALVIPPAWTKVWISTDADGHLQATGRDARNRKQYRYHASWRASRDATKFHRLLDFGDALQAIRDRTNADLRRPGLTREKVLATVVQLLELTLIRVGNEEYARTNKTYGLTTMKGRHVDVSGATLRFRFRGKSGKEHEIEAKDRRLATIVSRCQELPGHELFHFFDADGTKHTVGSGDVNEYLKEITGEEFTAKDFRTWAGTVLATQALWSCEAFSSKTEAQKNVVEVVKSVAAKLGNTPTVCRKSYIHPEVLQGYLGGSLPVEKAARPQGALKSHEVAVLKVLKRLVNSSPARKAA